MTFPQDVTTQNFGLAITNAVALDAGFLPVRITINQAGQRYLFTTFVGDR